MQTSGRPVWFPIAVFNDARMNTEKALAFLNIITAGGDPDTNRHLGLPDLPNIGDCLETAERSLASALTGVQDLRKVAE